MHPGRGARPPWLGPRGLARRRGPGALLLVLFLAVAGGAWPVVRRLTRRLESLKQGVEAFGAGALHQRVAEDGRDEVAAVGASFNRGARASKRWCAPTRACWPMPAMNCARRWRG
jgi:HAMP domain-containing protein